MNALDVPPRTRTDAATIARSLSKPELFQVVFDRHFAPVHRYLARRVGRELADDLAAQTFTIGFARRASFRPEFEDARPWLLGIATNLLMNHRRAERRALLVIEALGAQADRHAVERADSTLDEALAAALGSLDPDQRDVLLLYAWGELSYEEIATALAIPVGTVRSRLSRARAHLSAQLKPNPEELR